MSPVEAPVKWKPVYFTCGLRRCGNQGPARAGCLLGEAQLGLHPGLLQLWGPPSGSSSCKNSLCKLPGARG